jgi:hypothetical protein
MGPPVRSTPMAQGRQVEATVGTMAVVMLDIEVQNANKLPTPSDQEMIQALPAHGANQACYAPGRTPAEHRQITRTEHGDTRWWLLGLCCVGCEVVRALTRRP